MRYSGQILSLMMVLMMNTIGWSQKQNNQWRFGSGGGIDFNNTPPVFVPGSAINTYEGSASVADKITGALLFYTDGVTVWNAQNQVMPNGNGLLGGVPVSLSSTTAAVIIPKPGVSYEYYLVTIDEQSSSNGIRYSVIDMNLNGGLGDIIPGFKNIPIYQTTSEKLEVIPAADQQSYWLISHDLPGNSFLAFRVTDLGIATTPVVSSVGGVQGNGSGHLKINRQFNRLAMGNLFDRKVELFDFDNATGIVSNPVILNFDASNSSIYGVEFSPNGKFLYISNLQFITQYNISLSTIAGIENSRYVLPSSGFNQPASLQLGPDNKIYNNSGSVDVIDCPNQPQANCGFRANAIANQTAGGGYGLPKWVFNFTDTSAPAANAIVSIDSCSENAVQFSLINTAEISSISWNFGDAGSGINNTSTSFNPSHTFSAAGSYEVTAIINLPCGNDTLNYPIEVIDCLAPCTGTILTSSDTCIQTVFPFAVSSTASINSISWNFGDAGSGINNTSTSLNPSHTFSAAGSYEVTAIVNFTCGTDTLNYPIEVINCLAPCTGTILTSSDTCIQTVFPFAVSSTASVNAISWNFGDASSGSNNTSASLTPTHQFSGPGEYIVTAIVDLSCGVDTIYQTIKVVGCSSSTNLEIIAFGDTCTLSKISFTINTNQRIENIIGWNFDDPNSGNNNTSTLSSPSHLFSNPGTYNVRCIVQINCSGPIDPNNPINTPCFFIDTVNLSITILDCVIDPSECRVFIPRAFTPNNDGINDIFRVLANCSIQKFELTIFNRWGQQIVRYTQSNATWNGTFNGSICPSGTYVYLLKYQFPSQELKLVKGNMLLIR